jgi:prophage DNA circulation protein
MVQSGKLSSAPQYADVAGREAAAKRSIDTFNAENALRAQELGGSRELEALGGMRDILNQPDKRFEALKGMTSLYGTTPALASTFGQQALSAAELQQRAEQAAGQTATNALATVARNRPTTQQVTRQTIPPPRYGSPMRTPLSGRPVGGTNAIRRFYGGG